ncbi:MAG: hypothetical protein Q4G33_13805 [bacterium]|nr:hypothetical protein [bacterium]
MKIHNEKIVENFKVPEFFNQKITIITDGEIRQRETTLFYLAMSLVAITAKSSPLPKPLLRLNVYFLEKNIVTFILDEDMLGCFHQAIVFPVGQWRKKKYLSEVILAAMVEELCHAVWLIPDGPKIEEKVRDVYDNIPLYFSESEFLMRAYVSFDPIFSNRN